MLLYIILTFVEVFARIYVHDGEPIFIVDEKIVDSLRRRSIGSNLTPHEAGREIDSLVICE